MYSPLVDKPAPFPVASTPCGSSVVVVTASSIASIRPSTSLWSRRSVVLSLVCAVNLSQADCHCVCVCLFLTLTDIVSKSRVVSQCMSSPSYHGYHSLVAKAALVLGHQIVRITTLDMSRVPMIPSVPPLKTHLCNNLVQGLIHRVVVMCASCLGANLVVW